MAHERGFAATHVNHHGLHAWKDWDLLVEAEDWVLVTNNAVEFRGRYRNLALHPGVVFLVPSVPRARQVALLSAALDHLAREPDLVNTALDVLFEGEDIVLRRYSLP